MKESSERYASAALNAFAVMALRTVGAPSDMARAIANHQCEAEELGYTTHGLQLLGENVEWIKSGATHVDGNLETISSNPVTRLVDAHFAPGQWALPKLLESSVQRCKESGLDVLVVRRIQHIGCAAAYLLPLAQIPLVALLLASSSSERDVAPHGGTSGVYSANPIAAVFPSTPNPILIDTAMSAASVGAVNRAYRQGRALDAKVLIDRLGNASTDPNSFVKHAGSILPAGALDQGHKGFAMSLIVELLTAGLAGYGRANEPKDGAANTLFVLLIDPERFGGYASLLREATFLTEACRRSAVRQGDPSVRAPGDRARETQRESRSQGLRLHPDTQNMLETLAASLNLSLPQPLRY